MSLQVSTAGFLTLVQDFGRYRLQRKGITHGGPLDEHSYLWANQLLGNHYNSPCLEISLGGFAARFTKKTMIALCGADLSATLNGLSLPLWQSHRVDPGDEIRFGSPRSGLRTCLAVKQGFTVKKHLGSSATVIRERLGGLHQKGGKLLDGDTIPYPESGGEPGRAVPDSYIPQYREKIELRFIPNYSSTGCGDRAIRAFIEQFYTVTLHIDRMGYRLRGDAIEQQATGIVSQGIAPGAIQLPRDGQPIVLMKDRQTMGGYPQLGCVASLDCSLLAQSAPGTRVTFVPVTINDLEDELVEYKRFFHLDF